MTYFSLSDTVCKKGISFGDLYSKKGHGVFWGLKRYARVHKYRYIQISNVSMRLLKVFSISTVTTHQLYKLVKLFTLGFLRFAIEPAYRFYT